MFDGILCHLSSFKVIFYFLPSMNNHHLDTVFSFLFPITGQANRRSGMDRSNVNNNQRCVRSSFKLK